MRHWKIVVLLLVVVMFLGSASSVWAEDPTPTPMPTGTPTPPPEEPKEEKSPLERAKEIVETLTKIVELLTRITLPTSGPVLDLKDLFLKIGEAGVAFFKDWGTDKLFPDFEDETMPWNVWREDLSLAVYRVMIPVLVGALVFWVYRSIRQGNPPPNILAYIAAVILLAVFTQASGFWLATSTKIGAQLVSAAGGAGGKLFPKGSVWEALPDLLLGLSKGGTPMYLLLVLVLATLGVHLAFKMVRRYFGLFLNATLAPGIVSASLLRVSLTGADEDPKTAADWVLEFLRCLVEIVVFWVIAMLILSAAVSKHFVGYAGWIIIVGIAILDSWPEKILQIVGWHKPEKKEATTRSGGPASPTPVETGESLHVTPEKLDGVQKSRRGGY